MTHSKIVSGKTLLFFDEIQECPRAITSLKYFCENMKQLHVICAGSLLGVAVKAQNISFPVGKINRMTLYPMSFREFAIACGHENIISILRDWNTDREIPELYSVPMIKLIKEYFITGGMPEAVLEWITSGDHEAVEEIQDEILSDYADDFSKHAPLSDIPKIRWIWDSVPVQLAKENNKFMLKEGKRSAELEDSLQWLKDAGLVDTLHLVSSLLRRVEEFGLKAGRSEQEVKHHSSRYGIEYFPLNVSEYLELLRNTGFSITEMLWYSYLQSGFYAVK